MKILVLNGGSSSFKCWFGEVSSEDADGLEPTWEQNVDWSGQASPVAALEPALESLWSGPRRAIATPDEIEMVGHRIVHGGKAHRQSTLLTPEVRQAIALQVEFAPAHNRFEIEAIETVDRLLGVRVPQVAVFDTSFHATLEPAAYVYPGPWAWLDEGVRRYGFHGISYQYAVGRAARMLRADPAALRLILCHLGSGSSLAAVRGGKSVDTTMGFTPLEGLMMGARCGSVDPGIIIYLLRHCGYSADELDHILNQESGLKGLSGISGDMREILAARARGHQRARVAFDVYAHRLCREAGAMLAVLGGADALVFTGGVGENCPPLREVVCRQFAFLGLKLDAGANQDGRGDRDIAAADSAVRVLVIHAEEEREIARECYRLGRAAWSSG